MKSIKNHLSLIVALVSILFSIQVFTIVERSIDAYKENLANNYSVVVVSQIKIEEKSIKALNPLISEITELNPDSVIKRLNAKMDTKNIELLKVTLPKFYRLKLSRYPSPVEVDKLTKNLLKHKSVTKVENFSHNHDSIYKLLLLFKEVISIFAIAIFVVTILLIMKELRIWQYMHNERMSIMGLFGAPIWLSSAVLFRLAIVDAIISSILTFIVFSYLSTSEWILQQFSYIGIDVVIFDNVEDFSILFGVAIFVSILLASLIVAGHKEEV
ncbi:cell division protein FtsX [Sulfurimonas sp.]